MARPIAEIDRRSLRRLEANLDRLGTKVVPSAAKTAVRTAGRQAQILLAVAFRRHIEGGPAPATRVVPGSPSSSVLVREAPTTDDEISIDLAVHPRAARWLQFQLGDRRLRRPGEVGAARHANWVPQAKRLKKLGFRLPFGNLARGTLSKLVAMSESQSGDDKGVFYRKGSRKRAGGFFVRTGREGAPQLLVAAARQSRYRGNLRLQAAWTASVERAGGRMSAETARIMMREVEKMGRGGGGAVAKDSGPVAQTLK